MQLFADDTLLHITGNNIINMIKYVQDDLNNLEDWLDLNKLKLNFNKTKAMILNVIKDCNIQHTGNNLFKQADIINN